jgi:EAL domain-containing protein (putative c-di-GMP-specific phosphodiesterase class I)
MAIGREEQVRISVAAGETLFREGDPPGPAYLIEHGVVEITAHRDGQHVVLGTLGGGDLLGEMALIDQSPRTASAIALEDCALLVIDRSQIAERLAQADPIIRALLEGQLKRYRGALAAMRGQQPAAEPPPAAVELLGIGKIRLEAQLREALNQRALDLRLQPLLEIPQGRIGGYEALIRWTHPERGPVSPAEFIALAEETSLIVPVGEYVLDVACAALTTFHRQPVDGGPPPFVAINVSARQLAEEGLIDRIVARTAAAGLPHAAVKVEITESQALDYPVVKAVIARCHEHGIQVALDDFGTGYSNLGHLHELGFDAVKVDQSFARTMLQSPRAMAIVRAIVTMVHDLGADVVVEGIETEEQLAVLRELGCRYAQGYLIGRPQPIEELLALPA